MSGLVLGLTGQTGAGKSSLRPFFARYCCEVIDCDEVAREITLAGSPALRELAQEFGEDVLSPQGELRRAVLAQRAFASPEKKARLDAITHPRVLELVAQRIERLDKAGLNAVIDAPLLFESGADSMCDAVIAVTAPRESRLARITERDGITRDAALLRMNAQHTEEYYTARADFVLVNDGTPEQLEQKAECALGELLRIAKRAD